MGEKLAKLVWEKVSSEEKEPYTYTHYSSLASGARVPGGWLVFASGNESTMAFVPDPQHTWQ
jgi:hypothetical protein